jgi:hypothetical protein
MRRGRGYTMSAKCAMGAATDGIRLRQAFLRRPCSQNYGGQDGATGFTELMGPW